MSVDAIGWTFRHSEAKGSTLLVHLAIADSANDQNGNEIWMTKTKLAKKARMTRPRVSEAVARLVEMGYLRPLGDHEGVERRPRRYRFLYPDSAAVVFESRFVPEDDERSPTERERSGKERSSVPVRNTEPKREPKRTQEPPETASPSEPKDSGAKKARKRDLVWDAVVEVIGWDPKGGESKRVGKTVRLIREMCPADADDEVIALAVRGRARRYREEWPRAELSPEALTKWWSRFGPKRHDPDGKVERTRAERQADPAFTTDAWAEQSLTDEERAASTRRIAWHAFTRARAEERGAPWEATDPPLGWEPQEGPESTVRGPESSAEGSERGPAAEGAA